jgi:hypothetical protein
MTRRSGLVVAVLCIAACGTGDGEQSRDHDPVPVPAPTTSTSTSVAQPSGEAILEEVLLWMLSPTGTCPAGGIAIIETSDDPSIALLQALGFVPNARPSCQSPEDDG